MGKIIYMLSCTLDGYINDASGEISWAVPDEAMVADVTADLAGVTTHLYGRRMYESMAGWETDPSLAAQSPESAAFAEVWKRARKVVFSRTLEDVWTERTRLERDLTVEAIDRAKAETAGDLLIEGPTVTAAAFRLGLVDMVSLMIYPVTVGAGTRVFPDGLRLSLRLLREQRFEKTGMVKVTYETDRS
ncbi:dihydrofolate reductase family protein [Arthrobacter sp. zg-Y820]|uniref:dihydrofolate reductase family protein n=1 Tax=unclassified Arthrobacter TaxID=235627 RepID=UPI001E598860|nr:MULTISPECIES: dihydrofolate reductase family protein [unclassified Arthrobacter]MCC9198092.1 dihydrofolate reductase family protein [Arthrobacter sp. zg-Y820]MDK1280959.1 dihydrofolate reductase family protein [Arthrobacter sp. zg.Y820]WIB10433.1 dihydrofolate reductase family protein [Arthrobacter sp. zg-Y820]